MIFMLKILIVFGLLNIVGSFLMNTKDIKSAIVFKVIPFFGGVLNIIVGLELLQITSIF